VVLTWDYPLAWQQETTYVLHSVTLQDGRPQATDIPLTVRVLATAAGTPTGGAGTPGTNPVLTGGVPLCDIFTTDILGMPRPCNGQPWSVGAYQGPVLATAGGIVTLEATVCLAPGDFTVSVVAVHGGQRSSESNLVDLDLTTTTPCQPGVRVAPPVAAPQTPAPTSQQGGTVAGGLAIGGTAAVLLAVQSTPPPLPALVNLACVHWAVTGPCFCSPFNPCLRVEYFEPGWLVEIVKTPGDTLIPVLGNVLQAALAAVGAPAAGGGGAGNASGSGHTNLHFEEAHVYSFPQLLGGPCTGCGPSSGLGLHYASEMDPLWRTAVAVPSPLDLLTQVGVWGRLYPRSGKVIHSSEPVASALAVVRAMDIAHQPIGTPPNVDAHVVTQLVEERAACVQMAWPKMTHCFQAGTPPPLWETRALSLSGKYAFLIWRKRTCCVDPSRTTCGITTPGIGTYGANICPIPPRP
jgi:hypothetical protein